MKKLRITIGNKSYDVTVEDLTETNPYSAPPAASSPSDAAPPPAANAPAKRPTLPVGAGAVTSPMAGLIKSVLVSAGDQVKQGQALVILEAMKLENQITAPVAGSVGSVDVKPGDQVQEGHVLLTLE
ncbi:MAG: biotin/lipoyl-binding protein [Planctomycetales bacterium]|nr:biotin/lipoyl-binding protein [Planctomycetales bacterium]